MRMRVSGAHQQFNLMPKTLRRGQARSGRMTPRTPAGAAGAAAGQVARRRCYAGAIYAGAMFWLTWKRFCGSYLALTSLNR